MTMSAAIPTKCNVAILAGGMGTRLRSRTGDIPKPMAHLCGKPVLEHLIDMCRRYGLLHIALLVHHRHKAISEYFGDGSKFGVALTYCIEQDARGTAGALNDALPVLDDIFVILYGDTYADINLRQMYDWHVAGASQATIFAHPNDHPADSDLIEMTSDHQVVAVHPYPHPAGALLRNMVNAGLYVFNRDAVSAYLPATGKSDIAKHTLPALLRGGVRVNGYVSPEYIKDMGTPERLDKVEAHIASGLPGRLSGRAFRRAVFLDRDGTINVEVGHLKEPDQVTLIEGSARGIKRLNGSGYLAIVVTNQPVLARGDVDPPGLERIHARIDQLLGAEGAYLDRLYFCPHHPDRGFEGEVIALKMICDCRKPSPGLINRAIDDLGINPALSWIVGDSYADVLAGHRAGLRTILVETGRAGSDQINFYEPDHRQPDLESAIAFILAEADTGGRERMAVVGKQ